MSMMWLWYKYLLGTKPLKYGFFIGKSPDLSLCNYSYSDMVIGSCCSSKSKHMKRLSDCSLDVFVWMRMTKAVDSMFEAIGSRISWNLSTFPVDIRCCRNIIALGFRSIR